MGESRAASVEGDVAWCHRAVQDVSRTFALTVAELDDPMAREICVGYLLCRVADTVEDANHIPGDDQEALLRQYSRVLDPDSATTAAAFGDAVAEWVPADPSGQRADDWAVVAEAPRVVRTFQALPADSRAVIRPAVRELTDGMAMFVDRYADAGGLRLRTVEELEEYCWYAAGTVGTLVTGLLSMEAAPAVREQMAENARSFSMLLQLVNVCKDVRVDYREENNVYLPTTLLAEHGLDVEAVGDPSNGDRVAPVIRSVLDRAEGYLDGAERWLEAMPAVRGNSLAAWAIPFLLAVGTIRELEARPGDVLRDGDVKVSREEVGALLELYALGDPPGVATLRERVRRAPLHQH